MTHPRPTFGPFALILCASVVLMLMAPAAIPAEATDAPPPQPSLQVSNLATCHGHYTAALEHSRLVATENDGARLRRDMIEAMMNAYLTEHAASRPYAIAVMKHRVRGRSQLRNLFTTAAFDRDPRRQRLAAGQIRRLLRACDSLMLAPGLAGF